MAKLTLSLSGDAAKSSDLLVLLLNMRTSAHLQHLAVSSKSRHDTLRDFYAVVGSLGDRFAEAAMGAYASKLPLPTDLTYGLEVGESFVVYLNKHKDTLKTAIQDFADAADLQSILVEILELIHTTIYKLDQLE